MEFTEDQWAGLARHARERDIVFLSSAFSVDAVDLLERVGMPLWKVGSGESFNNILIDRMADTGMPVLLSTGMSTLPQIDEAVKTLGDTPLVLMHTTSTYPAKHGELNLAVIETLRKRYGVPVGYSGHEPDIIPTVMAVVGFGACAVERHITLDCSMWGSDQSASIEPRGMELISKYKIGRAHV